VWGLVFLWALLPPVWGQEKPSAAPDTAAWIGEVFRQRAGTRVVDLILPGSHDAGSFAITKKSKTAPGTPALYARFGSMAAGWSRTQEQDLERQLRGGIRYLDLRIAHVDGQFVLVHGFVSCLLKGALEGVRRFASAHPRELVLLDMQSMPPASTHDALDRLLVGTLEPHLVNLGGEVKSWTLSRVWKAKRNLVVLSRDGSFARRRKAYRNRSDLDSVWANTQDQKTLKARLDERLRRRNRDRFQCAYLTLTPTANTVLAGSLRGVRDLAAFSKPLFRLPGKWIPEWLAAGLHPNVVAVDFYDRTDVVAAVIAANRRRVR
jgi:hypothetical protein